MQGGAKKRSLSLEDQLDALVKKIKKQESALETSRFDMVCLKAELEKKKRFDTFIQMVSEEQCMICSIDLDDCLGQPNMAFASYECDCSKTRVLHLGCWTREFKCVCGQIAIPRLKSSLGRDVSVSVEEITDTESESEPELLEVSEG